MLLKYKLIVSDILLLLLFLTLSMNSAGHKSIRGERSGGDSFEVADTLKQTIPSHSVKVDHVYVAESYTNAQHSSQKNPERSILLLNLSAIVASVIQDPLKIKRQKTHQIRNFIQTVCKNVHDFIIESATHLSIRTVVLIS